MVTSLCDLVKTVMDWIKDSDNVPNYQLISHIILLISAVSVCMHVCVVFGRGGLCGQVCVIGWVCVYVCVRAHVPSMLVDMILLIRH